MSRRIRRVPQCALLCVVVAFAAMGGVQIARAAEGELVDYHAEAERALRAKNYGAARSHLLKALVADPFDSKAYQQLGSVFERMGKPDQAVESYDLCLMSLPPEDKRSRDETNRATSVRSRLRALDKAGQPMREAEKDFVARMIDLGETYQQSGKFWLARRAFRSACLIDPGSAKARAGLARAQKSLGEPALAQNLEQSLVTRAGRLIGTTRRAVPEDLLAVSLIPEGEDKTPVAGIRLGRETIKPEKSEPGIFFVAIHPETGKILGSEMFLTKDPVGSGARVSLFIERQGTGTILAAVSVGRVSQLPGILWQGLERIGIRRRVSSGDEAFVLALVGVKGAPRGSALWETDSQRAMIRLAEVLRFSGPIDNPKIKF